MNHKRTDTARRQHSRFFYLFVAVSLVLGVIGPAQIASAATTVTLDGDVHSNTANTTSTIGISHTTGTGTNRLMLVGVSWNCGTAARSISSVTFSYGTGPTVLTFDPVITEQTGTQARYAAIYSLPDPPSGEAGTVTVTFSSSVSNGIVAGVANFAGVDQTTPLGSSNGANGNSTAPSVDLTGLSGDELVFDTVFQGASGSSQTLTVGSDQTERWNAFVGNARAAASTEAAPTGGGTVTMSWTAASSSYWAIVAVAINPAAVGLTYDLTMAVDPTGGGTTIPADGATYSYPENEVVDITATPNVGYVFDSWTGDVADPNSASTTVTMDANKTVTATFTAQNYGLTMAVAPSGSGTTTPAVGGPYSYGAGATVDITATANAGYVFDSWAGGVADPNSPSTTVTMDGNKTVTADFVEVADIGWEGVIGSDSTTADDDLEIVVGPEGVAAGNTIIVAFASRGQATYDIGVTDDAGGGSNVYTEAIRAICYTHGRSYIFYRYVDVALVEGDTITVSGEAGDERVAVAGIVRGLAAVNVVDQVLENPTGTTSTEQGNSPYVGLTGTTSQLDELIVGVVGVEDSTGDAGTSDWSYGFVTGPTVKTSGGTYEWRVSLGYKIVSATGEFEAGQTYVNNPYWAATIATFKAGPGYPLDVSVTGNGTVTSSPGGISCEADCSEKYLDGIDVTLTAAADPSSTFVGWGGACTGTSPCQVTMDAAKSVTADFAVITHELTIAVDPAGSGTTVPPAGVPHIYDEGTVVPITATAEAGYVFDQWIGDVANANSPTTTVTIDASKVITAHFVAITHELTIAVDPAVSGTTDPAVGVHTYDEGTVVPITATATAGYVFDQWIGDVANVSSPTTTVTIDASKIITAHFNVITHELTIAVDPFGGGTTVPATGVHVYDEGSVVPITATSSAGYVFDQWIGDVANVNSPTTTVTISASKLITAHFTVITHELTIAVDPVGAGTTEPAAGVHIYDEGSVVPITATAASGYAFDYWTGAVANVSSPTTTVTIDASKIITAHFVDITLPDTGITAYPDDPSNSADASFSFISTETGSSFECQLDGGGFSACTSPKAYTGLADGVHTFAVRAIDASSNVDPSPASYSWTIDTVAPNTSITAHPADPSYSVDASFSFTSTEPGSTFECQLDGGVFSTCTSPHAYTGLDHGDHTFEVRAIDGVDNVDLTPASYSWTINWGVYLPIVIR